MLLVWGLVTIPGPVNAQFGNVNFIFGLSGNVWIKRVGSSKFERASTGLINVADELRLGKGAKARVLCGNFRRRSVSYAGKFVVEHVCYPGKRKINIRPGSRRCCSRNSNDPNIPYIISPRNTKIFHHQAISLRWNPVDGVKSYDVSLLGDGVDWNTKVSESKVVYSGKESFQPGSRYWVIVTADNGASSRSERRTGFSILDEAENKKIQAEISQLEQIDSDSKLSKGLGDDFLAFTKAEIYHSHGLHSAAIDVLEAAVKQDSKTRAVYQLLGEVYQEVGLNWLAKQRYLIALGLTQITNKLEAKQDQALIQYRLGEVHYAIGDVENSYKWYETARDSFRALKEPQLVKQVQENLDYLKEQGKEQG